MIRDFDNILVRASIDDVIDIGRAYFEPPSEKMFNEDFKFTDLDYAEKTVLNQWIEKHGEEWTKKIAQDILDGKIKVNFSVGDYDGWEMEENDIEIFKLK